MCNGFEINNSSCLANRMLILNSTSELKYLFSRNVFALETFFPMAEAFQEKYEPDGSTYRKVKAKGKCENSGYIRCKREKRNASER